MKTALMVIAFGKTYHAYAKRMLESAAKYFIPHTPVVFTEHPCWQPQGVLGFHVPESLTYPEATLQRYRMFHSARSTLEQFDQVFYCDADMLWVDYVKGEDIWSEGITATLHPGFMVERTCPRSGGIIPSFGEPERRRKSRACIWTCHQNKYYCGGFNGGDAKAFLDMSAVLHENIETDRKNGIIAIWHDESHLNCFLWNQTMQGIGPSKVLTPRYCYPEDYDGGYGWDGKDYPPILVALDKSKKAKTVFEAKQTHNL